jgi:glycosyltransferase involved in cell wall biosynthesis
VRLAAAVLARIVARADAVLGVSEDVVVWARRNGARRAEWTPVPAPGQALPARTRNQVRSDLSVPHGTALILTVARLAPQKGLDLAIAVASAVGQTHPVAWLIVGEGPDRGDLAARIAATKAPVRLLGHRDDLPDLYHAADLAVSTAAWEGQPLALQEALRHGVPVVATDVGGTGAVIGSGGKLVARDVEAVSAAIVHLLDHPEQRRDLRRRALLRGRELPSPADMLAHVSAVYARIGVAD